MNLRLQSATEDDDAWWYRSARARRRHSKRTSQRLLQFEPLEPRSLLAGEVLISEIMYHAASQDQRDEFVELFNPGTAPVNLAGWRFDSGTLYVLRSGSHLHVFDSLPYISEPAYSFELGMLGGTLTIDLLGGDDSLTVNTGGHPDLKPGRWGMRKMRCCPWVRVRRSAGRRSMARRC